ncbi:MAG TPA: hypothetical protein VHW23_07080 [Kofleriaceae bacterium]|nr:hypothetical protein [Kofleriaceae bacterium]
MSRQWLMGMAAVTLAGCLCSSDPVTETAYATMASYPVELTSCILQHDCESLCRSVFQIWDAKLQRCELDGFDGYVPAAAPGKPLTPDDLQQLRGATVRITYTRDTCSDDGSAWGGGDDGSTYGSPDDGSTDGGSTCDDGSCDGSTDDGSTCDDGSCDGSTDDGSTCDDGSCDGSGDDGSGDDGSGDGGSGDGGDATGGGSSLRHLPPSGARHGAQHTAQTR